MAQRIPQSEGTGTALETAETTLDYALARAVSQ
jgi:hypothetical protein